MTVRHRRSQTPNPMFHAVLMFPRRVLHAFYSLLAFHRYHIRGESLLLLCDDKVVFLPADRLQQTHFL